MQEVLSTIPIGKSGRWSVDRFTVKEGEPQFALFAEQKRPIRPGNYIRLLRDKTCIMSNTDQEIKDSDTFVSKAHGVVLVAGLGLGCVLYSLAMKKEVTKIIVIEKSRDVIKLIYKYYKSIFKNKIKIINANIFEYKPTQRYDCGWFDIWDTIDPGNLLDFKVLHMRYRNHIHYMEFWCRNELQEKLLEMSMTDLEIRSIGYLKNIPEEEFKQYIKDKLFVCQEND